MAPGVTPPSPQSDGKPIWKRGWAVAIAVVVLLIVFGSLLPDKKTANLTTADATGTTTEFAESSATTAASPAVTASPVVTAPAVTAPPRTTPPTTADPYASETVSQKNARRKAAEYLAYTAFSRTGLIKQLKYEGFSEADAIYGVDAINPDWFEQAAKKAKEYMEYSSFSRQSLINQLKYEGFTQAQAEHGADSVGL